MISAKGDGPSEHAFSHARSAKLFRKRENSGRCILSYWAMKDSHGVQENGSLVAIDGGKYLYCKITRKRLIMAAYDSSRLIELLLKFETGSLQAIDELLSKTCGSVYASG